jgi:hypothetical protein
MSRHISLTDFRGRREVLVRSDFALAPKRARRHPTASIGRLGIVL